MILADSLGDALAMIFLLIAGIMVGPPIILLIIGLTKRKKDPSQAKTFYLLALVYILVSGGICASMVM